MDQKYEETGQKFEETINQQIEILKVLKKAETDQKFEEKGQKFEETDQKNHSIIFIGKRTQNIRKSLNILDC